MLALQDLRPGLPLTAPWLPGIKKDVLVIICAPCKEVTRNQLKQRVTVADIYIWFSYSHHCRSTGFMLTNPISPRSPGLLPGFKLLLFNVTVCYLPYERDWLYLYFLLHRNWTVRWAAINAMNKLIWLSLLLYSREVDSGTQLLRTFHSQQAASADPARNKFLLILDFALHYGQVSVTSYWKGLHHWQNHYHHTTLCCDLALYFFVFPSFYFSSPPHMSCYKW